MKSWFVTYYSEAVTGSIKRWPKKLQSKYIRTIDLLEEFGPQIGMPYSKAIGNGLFEIRVKSREGIGRAFYCYQRGKEIVVLHSFIKKTQKTPQHE